MKKLHALLLAATLAGQILVAAPDTGNFQSPLDYTYGYWSGVWRQAASPSDPARLCIESGYYGFQWNIEKPTEVRFGLLQDKAGYREAGGMGLERLRNLPEGTLDAEVKVGGRTYKMTACRAGLETKNETRLSEVWLWESGGIAQHYELRELRFEDAEGNVLPAIGSLAVVAWPQSLNFTLNLRPEFDYGNGPAPGRKGGGHSVRTEALKIPDAPGLDSSEFTVECWFLRDERTRVANGILFGKNHNENKDSFFGLNLSRWGKVDASMRIGPTPQDVYRVSASVPALDVKGVWHHAVMTYDGKSMRIFANGKPVAETAINLPRTPGSGELCLGRRADGGFLLDAVFDDVRVWNRALSEEEIAAIFKNPETPVSLEGLVHHSHFDEPPTAANPVWRDATMSLRYQVGGMDKSAERLIAGDWTNAQTESLSLNCDLPGSSKPNEGVGIQVTTGGNQTVPTSFNARYGCIVAKAGFSHKVPEAQRLKRAFFRGEGDARNYDEFVVEVENQGSQTRQVPFLLEMLGTASITGLVPILCEPDGTPTGIPVQLSKNWHHTVLPDYLRAYSLLPAAPGKTSYLLRVVYGFYGSLPSASLSQLSLVGWGAATNGRWDQLAIGSYGETICFNPEFSASVSALTDVRSFLTRQGKDGKKWQWSDAGWGGDWLSVNDAAGKKLMIARSKSSYLSHGPCLPEVVYQGAYGSKGEVDFQVQVSTPRTDDHAKTFLRFRYDFRSELSTKGSWFFRLGFGKVFCPKIAIGNREGLIQELDAPAGLKANEYAVERLGLTGPAPWWVGFPGSKLHDQPSGSRGFVIRSYRATFGGKSFDTPTLSLPVGAVGSENRAHVDATIVPPAGIENFQAGDSVEMEIEVDVIPAEVDDYYGPNEIFRKQLVETQGTWKPFHHAAVANDLQIEVQGGTLLHKFPIVVQADPGATMIRLEIQGGTGAVPVRFEGLDAPSGWQLGKVTSEDRFYDEYLPMLDRLAPKMAAQLEPATQALDQTIHGKDFWETSRDPDSKTYNITYNLPLGDAPRTTWILKKAP